MLMRERSWRNTTDISSGSRRALGAAPAFVRDSLLEVDGAFVPTHYTRFTTYMSLNPITLSVTSTRLSRYGANNHGGGTWTLPTSWNSSCYRVGTETLSDWRQEVYDRYNPMLDSIRASADSTDVLAVAQALMDSLSVGTVYFTACSPRASRWGQTSWSGVRATAVN